MQTTRTRKLTVRRKFEKARLAKWAEDVGPLVDLPKGTRLKVAKLLKSEKIVKEPSAVEIHAVYSSGDVGKGKLFDTGEPGKAYLNVD